MDLGLGLNKIADALHLTIKYDAGKVSGTQALTVTTPIGLNIPVKMKAQKVFVNGTIGLLVHLIGDLYVVVAYYTKKGSMSLYYIDKGKLTMDGVITPPELFFTKTMELREVVNALRKSIVSSFFWKDGKWKSLSLPT